jgi:hypothetical protein
VVSRSSRSHEDPGFPGLGWIVRALENTAQAIRLLGRAYDSPEKVRLHIVSLVLEERHSPSDLNMPVGAQKRPSPTGNGRRSGSPQQPSKRRPVAPQEVSHVETSSQMPEATLTGKAPVDQKDPKPRRVEKPSTVRRRVRRSVDSNSDAGPPRPVSNGAVVNEPRIDKLAEFAVAPSGATPEASIGDLGNAAPVAWVLGPDRMGYGPSSVYLRQRRQQTGTRPGRVESVVDDETAAPTESRTTAETRGAKTKPKASLGRSVAAAPDSDSDAGTTSRPTRKRRRCEPTVRNDGPAHGSHAARMAEESFAVSPSSPDAPDVDSVQQSNSERGGSHGPTCLEALDHVSTPSRKEERLAPVMSLRAPERRGDGAARSDDSMRAGNRAGEDESHTGLERSCSTHGRPRGARPPASMDRNDESLPLADPEVMPSSRTKAAGEQGQARQSRTVPWRILNNSLPIDGHVADKRPADTVTWVGWVTMAVLISVLILLYIFASSPTQRLLRDSKLPSATPRGHALFEAPVGQRRVGPAPAITARRCLRRSEPERYNWRDVHARSLTHPPRGRDS